MPRITHHSYPYRGSYPLRVAFPFGHGYIVVQLLGMSLQRKCKTVSCNLNINIGGEKGN